MTKDKRRPNKKAKAAKKLLDSSKLLTDKIERDTQHATEFKSSVVTPRTNSTAMKARPHKKRG